MGMSELTLTKNGLIVSVYRMLLCLANVKACKRISGYKLLAPAGVSPSPNWKKGYRVPIAVLNPAKVCRFVGGAVAKRD